jgi:hypothetical protein
MKNMRHLEVQWSKQPLRKFLITFFLMILRKVYLFFFFILIFSFFLFLLIYFINVYFIFLYFLYFFCVAKSISGAATDYVRAKWRVTEIKGKLQFERSLFFTLIII